MANNFLGSPPLWIIDTASATPVSTDSLRIYRIRWVGGAGVGLGNECQVTDAAGNVIFDDFATGADYSSPDTVFPEKDWSIRGLAVPILATGKVYIYLK